jgi:hypothetical protein
VRDAGDQLVAGQVWAHSDALPIDVPGHVPWWPRPNVKLFDIMVQIVGETNRHAGHADILREQLDGRVGEKRAGQRGFPGIRRGLLGEQTGEDRTGRDSSRPSAGLGAADMIQKGISQVGRVGLEPTTGGL